MTVKVTRKKEQLPSQWSEMEVHMDGVKVSSLYGSDAAEVQMTGDTGELEVKYILSRSAKKQVKRGEIVEVSSSPLIKYGLYLMPVILLLIFASTAFDLLNFWILGAIVAAYIIFIASVQPLQIKNVTEESAKPDEMQNKEPA